MHFTYYSQLFPYYAPDACEAVSLRMALSAKGFHIPVSTRTFINRIPRSKDPNDGYTQNPYHYGDAATISPLGLMKYAKRYEAKVKNISGYGKDTFIKEIKHGNPIVFEGAYQMHKSSSDHVLLLIGYRSGRPGQFLVADPFQRRNQHNRVFWVSTTTFMHIYQSSLRSEDALAVIGKIHHKKHKKHKKVRKHSKSIKTKYMINNTKIYPHSYISNSNMSTNFISYPIKHLIHHLYYYHNQNSTTSNHYNTYQYHPYYHSNTHYLYPRHKASHSQSARKVIHYHIKSNSNNRSNRIIPRKRMNTNVR